MNVALGIVSILVVIILLVAIAMLFIGGGSRKKAEVISEEDEKIYDPVTGRMVDVDELILEHKLEMVTDELVSRVYSEMPEELRGELLERDVYSVLDAHFQAKGNPEEAYDPAELAILLSETYKVKGRQVSEHQIAWILSAVGTGAAEDGKTL